MKVIFSAALLLLSSFFIGSSVIALAQETASIPAGTIISMQPTVNECQEGAGEGGTCVNPTRNYIDALVAQALPGEQFSQALSDYVVALAALAQADDACNVVDLEIGEAIIVASSYALDPEQSSALATIGETIRSCEDFQTAAITPLASPN